MGGITNYWEAGVCHVKRYRSIPISTPFASDGFVLVGDAAAFIQIYNDSLCIPHTTKP
jgi:hypothetical protein